MKKAWHENPLQDRELVVRAPVVGHISKGVWVTERPSLAASFVVYRHDNKKMETKIDESKINAWKQEITNNSVRLAQEKEVIQKYGAIFNPINLDNLTKDIFKSFLLIKNNKHWEGIHRQGNIITEDMDKLKGGLRVLLDETKDIEERLNFLLPKNKQNYIKGLGRAIITPILLVTYPDKYGVWNSKSEEGLKKLGLFPEFKTKDDFASKYIQVNDVLRELANKYKVTLWQLDEIIGWLSLGNSPISTNEPFIESELPEMKVDSVEDYADFGLETHLEDFLIENWNKLDISKQYSILEEDGDIIGQQYHTPVGRIDILAKSKDGKEWLVIELKKGQTSDQVVGQTMRYIGWLAENKTTNGEIVKGLIIAGDIDEKLKYSLKPTNNIRMMTYSVSFKLEEK